MLGVGEERSFLTGLLFAAYQAYGNHVPSSVEL